MDKEQERQLLAAWSAWQEFLAALRALGLDVQGASFEGREGKGKPAIIELFGHVGVPGCRE